MPTCDLCGEEVEKVYVCEDCGVRFCEDCGDSETKLCEDCIEYEEEEWEEEW